MSNQLLHDDDYTVLDSTNLFGPNSMNDHSTIDFGFSRPEGLNHRIGESQENFNPVIDLGISFT